MPKRFLLARLWMDSLASKSNIDAILDALDHPPLGLEGMYEEAMRRIQSQSPEDRELAEHVILWTCFAQRPLSIFETQHALAIRPGEARMRFGACPDEEIMISVCAGLVSIEEEGSMVRFIRTYSYPMKLLE